MTTLTFTGTGQKVLAEAGQHSFARWNLRVTGTFSASFAVRRTVANAANATDITGVTLNAGSWITGVYVNEATNATVDSSTTKITAPGLYSVNGGGWWVAIDCTTYVSGTAVFECVPVAE